MKRKVTCLKERRELYNHRMTLEEYRKICRTYGEKLEKDGWILSVIEGGCISPDRSTIYIYFRDLDLCQVFRHIFMDKLLIRI